MESKHPHDGHRERMRQKVSEGGFAILPEHEQLEIILFSVIPRGNTNEIAHELLKKFGSLYAVLSSDIESLVEVKGIGVRAAEFLHNLPHVLGAVMRSKVAYETDEKFVMDDISSLKSYVFSFFTDAIVERVYALFLNKNYRLIKFEKINEGSIERVYIDVGHVVKRALKCNAVYVVLTHNHPSAAVYPSEQDIYATRELSEALDIVGVGMLDHIIIGGDEYYSFRENRLC